MRSQPAILARNGQIGGNATLFLKPFYVFSQGRDQPQVIQHHRTQVKHKAAHLLKGDRDRLSQIGQLFSRSIDIFAKQALAYLGLQDQVGQRLCRAIVHLPDQILPLMLLRLDHPDDSRLCRFYANRPFGLLTEKTLCRFQQTAQLLSIPLEVLLIAL